MCGRFALTTSSGELLLHFGLEGAYQATPRYNVAPSQPILAVREVDASGIRELTALRWGLIPSWADDPAIGNRLINARGETVAEKPAFRKAFARRRCLVPMSAFYEWKKRGAKSGEPWAFRRADGAPFAVAGLWETWTAPDGSEIETCALITTSPNDVVAAVHDRMPVIVPRSDYARWLDPTSNGAGVVGLLVPFPSGEMVAHRVSPRVGDVRHDDPDLLEPLASDGTLDLA